MSTSEDADFNDGIKILKGQEVATGGWVLLFDRDTEKECVYTVQA